MQETQTNNLPKNTQHTNIRTTYVFESLGLEKIRCYFVRSLRATLSSSEFEGFVEGLRTWDKQTYLTLSEKNPSKSLEVSLEKFLLVSYAMEHLEVPPLNNRM